MSAVFRHVWQIDSSLIDANLSDSDLNQQFRQLRGQTLTDSIDQSILEHVYLGQTDSNSYRIDIDRVAGKMSRIRQFQDLATAQRHQDLHVNQHLDLVPAEGPTQFRLITREVIDNMTLDQVVN
jgi:hypothetical protein